MLVGNNGNTITFRDVLTSIFFSSVDMITFYSGPITVSYIIIMIIIDQPLVHMHTAVPLLCTVVSKTLSCLIMYETNNVCYIMDKANRSFLFPFIRSQKMQLK